MKKQRKITLSSLVALLLVGIVQICLCNVSSSRLSIFTSFSDSAGDDWNFLKAGKPSYIKILDALDKAAQVKRISPQTKIICRIYQSSQPQNGDPATQAQNWYNQMQGQIQNAPDCDFWEGYNEPGVSSIADIQWMSSFEVKRVELLAAIGKKACIGNFATGTPDVTNPQAWPAFYPAISSAIQHDGILGLHEYAWPLLNSSGGWLTNRYLKVYDQFLIPSGKVIPLAITEVGLSRPGGGDSDGWKSGSLTALDYANSLEWYDSVFRKQNYTLTATVFQLGISGWDSFDISGLCTQYLIKYLQANQV